MPDMCELHAPVHRRRQTDKQSSTTHATRAHLGVGRVEGSMDGATFVWSHKSGSPPTTPVSPHRPKLGSSPRTHRSAFLGIREVAQGSPASHAPAEVRTSSLL